MSIHKSEVLARDYDGDWESVDGGSWWLCGGQAESATEQLFDLTPFKAIRVVVSTKPRDVRRQDYAYRIEPEGSEGEEEPWQYVTFVGVGVPDSGETHVTYHSFSYWLASVSKTGPLWFWIEEA